MAVTTEIQELNIIDVIRKLEGLGTVKLENCCEFIGECEDIKKYLTLKDKATENDEEYRTSADQITNSCTMNSSLLDESLSCLKREDYLIKVTFGKEEISLGYLSNIFEFVDEEANIHIKEDAYYSIKKEIHTFFGPSRFKKEELIKAIKDRGWEGKIIVETANFPYLNSLIGRNKNDK